MDLDPVPIARLQFAFTIIGDTPAHAGQRHEWDGVITRTYAVRVLKPSRLFVQLGNNSRKNRQAASLNDD
jgi:hypothetical protein